MAAVRASCYGETSWRIPLVGEKHIAREACLVEKMTPSGQHNEDMERKPLKRSPCFEPKSVPALSTAVAASCLLLCFLQLLSETSIANMSLSEHLSQGSPLPLPVTNLGLPGDQEQGCHRKSG